MRNYKDDNIWLMQGDCLERMKELDDNSVDSIVTDPPYGLSFMGKHWDKGVPSAEIWAEALRVLKPGGHLLAFAGTRTQHRMAVNIEDAGFEIRDMITWVYGSGFPKSHNVSKAIDKAAGVARDVISRSKGDGSYSGRCLSGGALNSVLDVTSPATEAAKQWDGWGTALKPALEPITVARKPFKGTVAANVLKHGTGAINIDECRVTTKGETPSGSGNGSKGNGWNSFSGNGGNETSPLGRWPANLIHDGSDEAVKLFPDTKKGSGKSPAAYVPNFGNAVFGKGMGGGAWDDSKGRWPANLIHDGSDEVVGLFPQTKSGARNGAKSKHGGKHGGIYGAFEGGETGNNFAASSGSAARFFYCAKASKKDRGEGNKHPTVKPTDLMRYLCRLVTPPSGIVLDPFMGSGSTGKAAKLEGFRFVGIELESESFDIAKQRIDSAAQ